MAKKDVQLNIRMSQELKERIEKSAKNNNRTINAEAITLIEAALSGVTIPQNIVPDDLISHGIIDEEDKVTLNNMLSTLIQDQVSKFTEKAVSALNESIKELSNKKTKP